MEGWSIYILWHLRHAVIRLLQAWRAVDRAYVDKTFNGQSWFKVSRSLPNGGQAYCLATGHSI